MIVDKSQTVIVTAGNGRPVPVRLEINPRAKRLILRLDETRREAARRGSIEAPRKGSDALCA